MALVAFILDRIAPSEVADCAGGSTGVAVYIKVELGKVVGTAGGALVGRVDAGATTTSIARLAAGGVAASQEKTIRAFHETVCTVDVVAHCCIALSAGIGTGGDCASDAGDVTIIALTASPDIQIVTLTADSAASLSVQAEVQLYPVAINPAASANCS